MNLELSVSESGSVMSGAYIGLSSPRRTSSDDGLKPSEHKTESLSLAACQRLEPDIVSEGLYFDREPGAREGRQKSYVGPMLDHSSESKET